MLFSGIRPSFLGDYEGCALNREDKFIRAVNSFLGNSFPNKELIIVSDGCDITTNLVRTNFKEYIESKVIRLVLLKKQKLFSGNLRTEGIKHAKGDYIIYLDSDDMLGKNHISTIAEQVKQNNTDWGYYNDFIYSENGLVKKEVSLIKDSIGTSSIYHKKAKGIDWSGCDGYGHDFMFIQKLIKWSKHNAKIFGASYIICHIPNSVDY